MAAAPLFWRPGTVAPGSDVDRANEAEGGPLLTYNRFEALTLAQQRAQLPIAKHRQHILYLLETNQVVVIVGATGCGKTTQIPQYLFEAGWCTKGRIVGCTQPRRVAATSVAQRVAQELGVKLGEEVGYSIRFDDVWTPGRTKIKYMTDGMLVREMLLDPLLQAYSVIMLDEAHERSINTDIIVGLLKKVLRRRPDLRLVVSSATLDAEEFAAYFRSGESTEEPTATVATLSLEGRTHPVDIHYSEEPCKDYLQAALDVVLRIHTSEPLGDILVFLTGQEEVERLVQGLHEASSSLKRNNLQLLPVPIYAGLTNDEQQHVFDSTPPGYRKVVVATNIAESSVTIDGIVYVIDCGFVKMRVYNYRTNSDSLVIAPTSQASAQQRAGRAGRVRPGKAYRLYPHEEFLKMRSTTVPEIQRSNLTPVVLQLKALGIFNIARFDFMSAPPAELMARALEILYALGALDDSAQLTMPLGHNIAEFPLDPLLSKVMLASAHFKCSEEIATIAAMLTVQNVFVLPAKLKREAEQEHSKFFTKEGDHITLFNVYQSFIHNKQSSQWCSNHYLNHRALSRAVMVRRQLVKYLHRFKVELASCEGDDRAIRQCLTSGYFAHAARLQPDGTYRSVRDNINLSIHPNSVLFKMAPPEWVIYSEVTETTKAFMRDVCVIDPLWLSELAPHFYEHVKR